MSARIPQTTNDVCVLGLGRTGEALTRHLLRHPDAGHHAGQGTFHPRNRDNHGGTHNLIHMRQ